jgi:glycosyltransferase involved in cell wall biosynthesis
VRLMALIEDPEHVCCRYRLRAFVPYLTAAGHHVEMRPLPRRWLGWLSLRRDLRRADGVLLLRKLLRRWQLHLVRHSAQLLLYDFDDAIFHRDSYALRGWRSSGRSRRFTALMRAADAVVAGNAFLQSWAQQRARSQRIHVIPTCVEPSRYRLAAHPRTRPGVELAWIGSSSTLRGLERIRPLLEQLGQRGPGLHLRVICDRFLELNHLPVHHCVWSEATEVDDLAAADIGISWLPDDLWSRGKCGLKVLQYMAAGLPVVANPVGVQAEMVQHGRTGFLVETADEWIEAILRLADDPALRRRMGQAGRQRVETEYSVAAGAAGWNQLLEGLARRNEAA